jgi:hypothetical protein
MFTLLHHANGMPAGFSDAASASWRGAAVHGLLIGAGAALAGWALVIGLAYAAIHALP